jgi:hypothetical protein
MMYFIPWCVFLLVVILAVPIAAMLDNRQRRAAMGPAPDSGEEPIEGEAESPDEGIEFEAEAAEPGDAMAEFEEFQ